MALESTRAALDEHPQVEEARFWLFDDRAQAIRAREQKREMDRAVREAYR